MYVESGLVRWQSDIITTELRSTAALKIGLPEKRAGKNGATVYRVTAHFVATSTSRESHVR